jgi:hypothetical protein
VAVAGKSSNSSSGSSNAARVQAVIGQQRVGDVMFRARALANRGAWVEVVSSRDWVLLEGRVDNNNNYNNP